MNAMEWKARWGRIAGATLGIGALVATVGCGTRDVSSVSAQSLAASQGGMPVVVSCEPHQRAMVRPMIVNGATISQVECVAAAAQTFAQGQAPIAGQPLVTPVSDGYRTARVSQLVYDDLGDATVVSPRTTTARPVRTRQVVYDEREPVKQGRSVKKSAIIIGSSAGVGAGVGAAVGGKKGALIGAAIGGGGAAIWDQMTRRK